MIKNGRIVFICLLSAILVLACSSRQVGEITPVEAIHLVEKIVNQELPGNRYRATGQVVRLITTKIKTGKHKNNPAYVLDGEVGEDHYESIVDAKVARVMEITKNGESFYVWAGVTVIGHRGTVKFAPENTIPAFESAIEHGADLLEMDVRETLDGALVIIHDDTLGRTTNGTGKVAEHTLKEIKELDAGSWFSPEFEGVRVPTLREVLHAIKGKALPDIDFKAGSPSKLIGILREQGFLTAEGEITLYVGNWDLMHETLKLTDGFIIRPTVPIGYVGLPIVIQEFYPPIINIDWKQFSEKLVREIHVAGRKSMVNTMGHDTEMMIIKMIETAPDYIQSDHIEILMSLLRERGLHQ